MFEKLLIANRGEIACRIVRTARRLGIATVAVYSDADSVSQHAAAADEAVLIGGAAAIESYLNADAIIAAGRQAGADAVHPGYGFLSENAEFAEACADAGLTFIGPPASAMRAMGAKHAAKALMESAGVPVVPGYHGDDQTEEGLLAAARDVGFPVLIKASAGGGGRGMRIVEEEDDFARSLEGAKREAASGFGDDRVLIERYLQKPRHVEVQVFGDTHGNVIHLLERECSIQRRHQKVIEEAPAPGMTAATRHAMGEAAVSAARAIDYVGAGTVEFIVDGTSGLDASSFFFMEMNTRLQVEHPVTEMITGLDLVEWQLHVAAGHPLPVTQEEVTHSGHAIEARIYAENPAKRFLPSPGRLTHLRLPDESAHVRVDAGVVAGDSITPHYDPLIAKLVVWDEDRARTVRRLSTALTEFYVIGLQTNRDFLLGVSNHYEFKQADVDTGFIDRHLKDLIPEPVPAGDRTLALATLAVLEARRATMGAARMRDKDPFSPWHGNAGWQLNTPAMESVTFIDSMRDPGSGRIPVSVQHTRSAEFTYELHLPGGPMSASGELTSTGGLLANLNGIRTTVAVYKAGDELWIVDESGRTHRLSFDDPTAAVAAADVVDTNVIAPLPGKVSNLLVAKGDSVRKGEGLVVIEAMKMEHTVTAPGDGTVKELHYVVGDLVDEGASLLDFEG